VAGAGLALFLGASLTSRGLARPLANRLADFVWGPSRRLRAHFSYLDLDPKGVDQYIEDYERYLGKLSRLRSWPDGVFTGYLLSTDFFQHGGDESRQLQYVGLYAPYVTPCSNPFARFD
jgi:hypothetical protein